MLKSRVFPIEKIYVPTKRRQTLDVEKVRQIAESMLQKGQETPIMVREDGERLVLVEGLSVLRRANDPGLPSAGQEALTRRSHLGARPHTTGVTP